MAYLKNLVFFFISYIGVVFSLIEKLLRGEIKELIVLFDIEEVNGIL